MGKAKRSLTEQLASLPAPCRLNNPSNKFECQFDAKTQAELAELKRDYNAGCFPGWSHRTLRLWLMETLSLERLSRSTISEWLRRDT